ncbi:MAG: DnaJ domain-containing protein [Deltaproteobacteria bacterium]|nr:DnaJ domain-containing protein [Deltaproteobacteria bacterium]MBW2576976.1 DnaJ domain-containing protein [Deltaproteobacteria bacterium]MBW2692920.1 DnaJ domain-containing protein [Deltaproteobacteria bacterium]
MLSRIDGHTSWTLLRQIGGLAPEDVDRCIERWMSEGVVEIDESKSASAEVPATVEEPKVDAEPVDYMSDPRIDTALDITPELQAQILEFSASLDKPYFELLDIPRDADAKQIKRAYFSLSKVYHPDRYFRANLGDYTVRLEQIFRKLVEAYELLSDPNTRAEIERTMGVMPEPEPEPVAEESETDAAPERKLPPRKLTKRQTLERLRRHFRLPPQILAERKLKASHFFDAAMVAAKRERWQEAAPSLRLAIAFDPWNDEYRKSFSNILSRNYEQRAIKLLDEADGPVDPGDKSEALRLLEEVLIHRPADPDVNHRAALLALDIHELERATEYAEAACELCPESAGNCVTLARVLRADGRREKAKTVLTEAARIDPGNEEVQAELQKLRR